jgi:zinc transporter 1
LLQGVPTHISLEAVRESINEVDGVSSLHEVSQGNAGPFFIRSCKPSLISQLHIWQLTEKTVVASVHVLVSRDTDYMAVADNIRKILHEYGVHSSTIQPEFAAEDDENSDNDVSSLPSLL